MTGKINLRPATQTDTKRMAHLWVSTFPDKFGPVLGTNSEAILGDWLRLSQRHLQTTTVAEVTGIVVGYIVLETPTAPQADDGRWLWHALQLHNGFFGALRGLLLMLLIDNNHHCGDDEVYIEMLGVAPAWRGRGIGRHLINHAKAIAQTQNIKWLALHVAIDNTAALELYKKLGFQIKSEQRSRLLKWITGHPGYCEMVLEIG